MKYRDLIFKEEEEDRQQRLKLDPESGLILLRTKRGAEIVGPYVLVAAELENQQGGKQGYLLRHYHNFQFRDFIVKDITEALPQIEQETNTFVLKPTLFKQFLLLSKANAPSVVIAITTGWSKHFDNFYAPPIQNQDNVIYDNEIFKFFVRKNTTKQHEIIQKELSLGSLLGFLYLFSISSIFVAPLKATNSSLFVIGQSGAGKTYSCKLAVSLFYDIFSHEEYFNASGTPSGMEFFIKNFVDLPVLLDELRIAKVESEEIVFLITAQSGKKRGTKDLKLRLNKLASNVFLTGERDETFTTTGAFRRSFIFNIKESQDICETLKEYIDAKAHACVGAGMDYVEYLLQGQIHEFIKNADKFYKMCASELQKILSPIYAALEFTENFYKCSFKRMRDFIEKVQEEKVEELSVKKDTFSQLENAIVQFVFQHYAHFEIVRIINNQKAITKAEKSPVYGRIDIPQKVVHIIPSIFFNICKENNITAKTALSILSERELLILKEHNRNQNITWLSNKAARVISIKLELNEDILDSSFVDPF